MPRRVQMQRPDDLFSNHLGIAMDKRKQSNPGNEHQNTLGRLEDRDRLETKRRVVTRPALASWRRHISGRWTLLFDGLVHG